MSAPHIPRKFIVIEAVDGAGKTTQSQRLARALDAEWRRFPDRSTPFGAAIDSYLRGQWRVSAESGGEGTKKLSALAFQALQIANRVEATRAFENTLETRHIVCDRYWPSGVAYGGVDGLDPAYIERVSQGLLQPDLFVLIDVPTEIALERLKARGDAAERYDNAELIDDVRRRYQDLWRSYRNVPGWEVISGVGTADEVFARLMAMVNLWEYKWQREELEADEW